MERKLREEPRAHELLSIAHPRGRSSPDCFPDAPSVKPGKLRRSIHSAFGLPFGPCIQTECLLAWANLADPQLACVAGIEAQWFGCAGAGDAKKMSQLVC